jgi:broad specificity phosphatase PhoE
MRLTPNGRRAAYEFGEALPRNGLVRFFSSPVGRCVVTSSLIEQGCLASGGVTENNSELDVLYVFYVRDLPKLGSIYFDMARGENWPNFFRNWSEGVYSPDLAEEPAQSAQTILNAFVDLLQEPGVGNICISHDWNLFLIKEQLLGLRPEDHEYIQYLEGVVIYKQDVDLSARQAASRAVSVSPE